MKKLNEWTKKLGQQHWSIPNSSETLCGKPMLGNNYKDSLGYDDKTTCQTCLSKVLELQKQYYV